MLISRTINDALIEIGVVNPTDEASPRDLAFGLRTLDRIIDSYNTQNLIITYLQDIELPLPATWKNNITIGAGKDIDIAAPIEVQGAFFRQGNTDYGLQLMSPDVWSSIGYKFDVRIPTQFYVQNTDTNDLNIYFDCIPQSNLTLHLMAKMPYVGVNSVGNAYLPTDDINWTYGFEKMLMLRLAVELSSSYEITPSQLLISRATEAEQNLMTRNYQAPTLKTSSRFSRSIINSGFFS